MMVMALVDSLRGPNGFQVGFQTGKGLLRAGQVAGLQRTGEVLIIRVRLAVLAEWLIRRRGRSALQRLLKGA